MKIGSFLLSAGENLTSKANKLSQSSLRLRLTAAMEEVVQEEPSGAGLAQVKSDAYGNLDAKAFLSGLVGVSG